MIYCTSSNIRESQDGQNGCGKVIFEGGTEMRFARDGFSFKMMTLSLRNCLKLPFKQVSRCVNMSYLAPSDGVTFWTSKTAPGKRFQRSQRLFCRFWPSRAV